MEALSHKEFLALEQETHVSQVFNFARQQARVHFTAFNNVSNSELLHYHEEPHLTLVVGGGLLDKRKGIENERFSGELMFFYTGEPHQTINKVFPTSYVSLVFAHEFVDRNILSEAELKLSLDSKPEAKFAILRIYKEMSLNDEFSDASSELLLYNLIDEKKIIKPARPRWIEKVRQLLNDNWNKDISLDELAMAANVHPKTVSRYFPKYFACTLGEYRRRLKIERSLALIKNSKYTLTEVAHECNFFDQSHFIRTFKQMTGFLPKQFRRL